MTSDPKAAMLRCLARREYSREELYRRLVMKGFDEMECRRLVDEATRQGWQSDERYAEAYSRSRVERLNGPLKIRAELRARGVADPVIEQALSAVDADWVELARAFVQRHARLRQAPLKARQALQRRGFAAEHARRALAVE